MESGEEEEEEEGRKKGRSRARAARGDQVPMYPPHAWKLAHMSLSTRNETRCSAAGILIYPSDGV